MLRYLIFLIATVLIFSATHTANAQKTARVEVKDVVVKEAKGNSFALEISWGYVEQENLRRPDEIMVIAVFTDSKGKERKSTVNIPVGSGSALPTSTKVVINHEEQIISPRDIKFVVTVAPKIKDGTSNIIAGRKEIVLLVSPTR